MSSPTQKTSEDTGINAKYGQVLALIEAMVPIERACRSVGLSRNTFYWLKKKEKGGTAETVTASSPTPSAESTPKGTPEDTRTNLEQRSSPGNAPATPSRSASPQEG